jgi:hypothetical protein
MLLGRCGRNNSVVCVCCTQPYVETHYSQRISVWGVGVTKIKIQNLVIQYGLSLLQLGHSVAAHGTRTYRLLASYWIPRRTSVTAVDWLMQCYKQFIWVLINPLNLEEVSSGFEPGTYGFSVYVYTYVTDITASNYTNSLTLKKETVRSFETL